MSRYLMKLCYDGTAYHGWQKQQNGLAIQEVLERAFHYFSPESGSIIAAGRTDTGVHALAQYAHFDYAGRMQPEQMLLAFRRLLPPDIKVLEISRVSPWLSARYQAYERSYRYLLAKETSPFSCRYSGFMPHLNLALGPMQEAAIQLLGRHDFSSFGRANPEVPNRICELRKLEISETEEAFIFEVVADRFLHNMVRRIVGTLANISHFKLPASIILDILADRCPRQNLVTTAPASGLYLIGVKYPVEFLDESYVPEKMTTNEVLT